jgi:diguanylate cyclase (GGDEF)-like protein
VVCNRHYSQMFGLAPEQTRPGTPLRAILEARVALGNGAVGESFVADRLERVARHESYCIIDEAHDGRIFSVSHQLMSNGGWVGIHQDITSQKRVEAELAHMARHDPLTGLANRAVFLANTNEALARARQHGEHFSILMLDLDQFKEVNDSLGHATGDSLLRAVAERFRVVMRDADHVARLGGDEFALLQTVGGDEKDHRASTIALADRILQTVAEPYDLDGRKVVIGLSIGIALAPDDGGDADTLIRNADLALYRAKSEGRNRYRLFEASMEAQARERRELEGDMRNAMARDEFELHYQTIFDAESGACCGAEALIRWRHPERGLIFPDQFIGLAEESGFIVPLGAWILRRACADAATWPPHLKLAVNLSPMQFKHCDLPDILNSALGESGLAPGRLELEITETVLIEKNEENLAVLHQLKHLGASIVLDDFGVGYSSMRYLQEFPIDKIKIDKSFIQSMPGRSDSMAIVCAIAGLARNLDIETTAEGVETAEQLALLRGAGCQSAQGYLFSRPVPAAALVFESRGAAQVAARVA